MIGWWVRGVLSLCLCLAVVLVCLFVPLVVLALLPVYDPDAVDTTRTATLPLTWRSGWSCGWTGGGGGGGPSCFSLPLLVCPREGWRFRACPSPGAQREPCTAHEHIWGWPGACGRGGGSLFFFFSLSLKSNQEVLEVLVILVVAFLFFICVIIGEEFFPVRTRDVVHFTQYFQIDALSEGAARVVRGGGTARG